MGVVGLQLGHRCSSLTWHIALDLFHRKKNSPPSASPLPSPKPGGSSKTYSHIKRLMFSEPQVLHALLKRLADSLVEYIDYQARSGAQVVQIFDSWAAHMSPCDFDEFAGPYLHYVIHKAHQVRWLAGGFVVVGWG